MSDMIDRDAAIQAVFDWEQGKISGTIADAIAALPAAPAAPAEDVRAGAHNAAMMKAWDAVYSAKTLLDAQNAIHQLVAEAKQ